MTDDQRAPPLSAEQQAEQASESMRHCLAVGTSFRLEAGAGAGKTHALIEALRWLVEHRGETFTRARARVACITYTNVAVNEIVGRLGSSPTVWVSTIHSFLWNLMAPFQKALREELEKDDKVRERLEDESATLSGRRVSYNDVGRLRVHEAEISISHDQVLSLAVALLEKPKFRKVWLSRFPVLLLDEYQDTNLNLMAGIREHLLGADPPLQVGLFGDHWQMIYDKVCGLVDDNRIAYIPKEANFRSCSAIVEALNRIRPDLPQAVSQKMASAEEPSDILVFHTNSWPGSRGAGQHKNALHDDLQDLALEKASGVLNGRGWHLDEESTSILRLTNKAVARTEGFPDLLGVFQFPDDLLKRQDPFVDCLAGGVEPAAALAAEGKIASALAAIGWPKTNIRKQADKRQVKEWLQCLMEHRANGTVGDVIAHLHNAGLLSTNAERSLSHVIAEPSDEEDERAVRRRERWNVLKQVPYSQLSRWYAYESGNTMLSTKHGTKGAQFDEVVVIFAAGWSKYNFPRMLVEWDAKKSQDADVDRFERARNLFYVTVSRARHRLALVFLETVTNDGLVKLEEFFGKEAIAELPYESD